MLQIWSTDVLQPLQIAETMSGFHRGDISTGGIHRHILPVPSPEIITVLLNRELERVRAAFLNPDDSEVVDIEVHTDHTNLGHSS
jgi:hypothetical protein